MKYESEKSTNCELFTFLAQVDPGLYNYTSSLNREDEADKHGHHCACAGQCESCCVLLLLSYFLFDCDSPTACLDRCRTVLERRRFSSPAFRQQDEDALSAHYPPN